MNGRLRALVVGELLSVLRDPKARMVLLVPPLLQLLIFSFAATLEVRNVDVALFDESRTPASRELVHGIEAAGFVREIAPVASLAELEDALDRQRALVGVRVPPGFAGDLAAGRPARVQVLLDGRRANAAQITLGYLREIARRTGAEVAGPPGGEPQGAPRAVVRHAFNPRLEYTWFIVPSLSGILAMFLSLLVTALSIARERELGTFDQLLVSPVTPFEIILGKTLPAVGIGSVMALVMVGAAVLFFRVPFTGSFPLLVGCLVLFIVSVVGVGLMLSAVCRTQQQAILGTFAFGIPTVLISGFATPVENMPRALQLLAEASPLKHYLIIVQGSFLKALPPAEVAAHAWPLAAIAAVTLTSAVFFVRWRLG